MVTTSSSVRIADPTRVPLTNVPLTLLSRISVPSGVGTNVACWRDAKTSETTMSLSAARPIVMAPAVPAADDERGENNFTKRVARFDTSAVLASITVNSAAGVESGWGGAPVSLSAGGAACGLAAEPALTTVSSSGGVPRGGIPDVGIRGGGGAWRGGETGCLGGEFGGLAGCLGGIGRDGATLGPLRAGFLLWPPDGPRGGRGGCVGFVCSGSTDQVRVGGPDSGVGLIRPVRLVWPCCGPIAKVSRGPCGFPTLMLWPSWISMTGIR